MHEFTFHFEGRKKGAIGCYDFFIATRKADSVDEARQMLYDEYDHVRVIKVRSDLDHV